MKKRMNISEELKLNDDITLNDGSELKDEAEKVADEFLKDAQKDIDEKNKFLDDIKDAEAPKAEANDGSGKSLKIKQFVERLSLDETNDNLNEDFDEFIFNKRSDAVHQVYSVLEAYVDVLTSSNVDILEECESVCEEALIHLEDELR